MPRHKMTDPVMQRLLESLSARIAMRDVHGREKLFERELFMTIVAPISVLEAAEDQQEAMTHKKTVLKLYDQFYAQCHNPNTTAYYIIFEGKYNFKVYPAY